MNGIIQTSPATAGIKQVLWNDEICRVIASLDQGLIIIDSEKEGRVSITAEECFQLVVQHTTHNPKKTTYFPLHPIDWSTGIKKINQQINFQEYTPFISHESDDDRVEYARLVTEAPMLYTAADVALFADFLTDHEKTTKEGLVLYRTTLTERVFTKGNTLVGWATALEMLDYWYKNKK